MDKPRENEIFDILRELKHQNSLVLLNELLQLRRERYRDRLEKEDNREYGGRALECKDLLQIFS